MEHHRYILKNKVSWHWSNLLLFNDNWSSTVDLWITEVIPTLVFSIITGEFWILAFYYFWTALIQEHIEHNDKVNVPLLTSGQWHLIHHYQANKNYGLFTPFWDLIFGTYKNVH